MLLISDFYYLIHCFQGFYNKYILNLVNAYYIRFLYNKKIFFWVPLVVLFLLRYFLFGIHFRVLLLLLYLRIVYLLLFFLRGFLLLNLINFFDFLLLEHYYYYYLFHYYFLDFLNYHYFPQCFFYFHFLLFLHRI